MNLLAHSLYSAVLDATLNYNAHAKFANKEVDSLFAQARAQSNPEARATLAIKALQLWVKPVNNIPLYVAPQRLFMNKRITGAPASFSTFLYYPWAAELGGT